ncbi:MAG: hypothetical protein PHE53_01600 [Thermoguttaceae bacterium]|nr:hypothetical protein [Thermoguttaceae bacterium]
MARKISSSRRLREDYDDYEHQDESLEDDDLDADSVDDDDLDDDLDDSEDGLDHADDDDLPVKKTKKAVRRKTSRSKTVRDVRQRAYWGVFSPLMQQVALFEYSQKEDALKDAEERSKAKNTPFFVQIVKKNIDG